MSCKVATCVLFEETINEKGRNKKNNDITNCVWTYILRAQERAIRLFQQPKKSI